MSLKSLTLSQAAKIIKRGGVVVYPTETFYGLGADPENKEAVGRIFEIKKREKGKPIIILLSSPCELWKWVRGVGARDEELMRSFWPGPLTLLFTAKKSVSPLLTAGTGKIGVRVSSEKTAVELCRFSGGAITSTSANFSGRKPLVNPEVVWRQLGKKVDGMVGGIKLKPSKGSTILDVSDRIVKVIREGDTPLSELRKIPGLNI